MNASDTRNVGEISGSAFMSVTEHVPRNSLVLHADLRTTATATARGCTLQTLPARLPLCSTFTRHSAGNSRSDPDQGEGVPAPNDERHQRKLARVRGPPEGDPPLELTAERHGEIGGLERRDHD